MPSETAPLAACPFLDDIILPHFRLHVIGTGVPILCQFIFMLLQSIHVACQMPSRIVRISSQASKPLEGADQRWMEMIVIASLRSR